MAKFKVGERVRVIAQGQHLGKIMFICGGEVNRTYRVDAYPKSDTGWIFYENELEKYNG